MKRTSSKNKEKNSKPTRKRIHALDELRGFSVFCMVFYHAFYSIGVIFNVPFFTMLLNFFMPAEPFFAALFIVISGISSNLSHSNISRGAKLLCVALAVSLVTYIVEPDFVILFGVLHMLSAAMLLYGVLQKPLSKVPTVFGMIISAVMFFATYDVSAGYLGIKALFGIKLPPALYSTDWLFPLGFPKASFVSSDYFPLLPWIFAFLFGTFLGRYAAAGRFPKFTYKKHIPFFSFLGRHALIIYVLHQPVIFGLAYLVSMILK